LHARSAPCIKESANDWDGYVSMEKETRSGRSRFSGTQGAAFAGLIFWMAAACAQQPALPTTKLSAGIHVIQAEVASTMGSRAQGLMQRKSMAQGAGMLFLFDEAATHCMWMKNTLIPLSVAFIDERGDIVNIADMQPLDETTHCALRPVPYALEMNQGWFKKRGISSGTRIQGLERFSAAPR
jgi:uncharacterized membrane protein (UPF0127 family)